MVSFDRSMISSAQSTNHLSPFQASILDGRPQLAPRWRNRYFRRRQRPNHQRRHPPHRTRLLHHQQRRILWKLEIHQLRLQRHQQPGLPNRGHERENLRNGVQHQWRWSLRNGMDERIHQRVVFPARGNPRRCVELVTQAIDVGYADCEI